MSKYKYAVQDYDGEVTLRDVKPEICSIHRYLWWTRNGERHSNYEVVYSPKGIKVTDWASRIVDLSIHDYKIVDGLLTAVSKGHIHAEKMKQYAEDATKYDKPWELWQYKFEDDTVFNQCTTHPQWKSQHDYRRTPETININGYDVPLPVTTAPNIGTYYYTVCFGVGVPYQEFVWDNSDFDRAVLTSGLIHSNAEAAALHTKALLSFTMRSL